MIVVRHDSEGRRKVLILSGFIGYLWKMLYDQALRENQGRG
jgi:hypothetical protein